MKPDETPAFAEIIPENGTKNTDPAPKYDPCRKFRKGDKVRVVECNGRDYKDYDPYTNLQTSELYTVLENESEAIDGGCGDILIAKDNIEQEILFCFLELVTPVEELERYVIIHNKREKFFDVAWKDDDETDGRTGRTRCRATYWYNSPPQSYTQTEAKAAADAECARLNAEYRKEKE